jgi:hypothetical protein
VIDERDPAQEQDEREATSEGRAEIGPLTGIKGAASGLQPGGTKPDGAPGGAIGIGSVGADGGPTRGTATGNTAAPPNR